MLLQTLFGRVSMYSNLCMSQRPENGPENGPSFEMCCCLKWGNKWMFFFGQMDIYCGVAVLVQLRCENNFLRSIGRWSLISLWFRYFSFVHAISYSGGVCVCDHGCKLGKRISRRLRNPWGHLMKSPRVNKKINSINLESMKRIRCVYHRCCDHVY